MTEAPTSSAATYGDIRADSDRVRERLRKLSKECLVLAFSTDIAARASMFYGGDAELRGEYIDRECKQVEDWRQTALSANRIKRLSSRLDRFEKRKPKRRRRRRKAW